MDGPLLYLAPRVRSTLIDGVELTDLKIIPDERGAIFHMLRRDDPHFEAFGEIYFSMIYRTVVKAWHYHKEMTLNYACIYGQIVVGLLDLRYTSPTYEQQDLIMLDAGESYKLLTIPPRVWNGFRIPQGSGFDLSIVANCATLPHDPKEIIRVKPDRYKQFDWGDYSVGG